MNIVPFPFALQSPFHALRWNAQELADAVPLRLHALFAEDAPLPGLPLPAANDTRPPVPRRWSRAYAGRRDLPARIRIHN